jgi:6-phosphogluconate dehydrogenase
MSKKVNWGIIGMGVMGTQLSRNFARNGMSIALYNRRVNEVEEKVAEQKITAFSELKNALPFEALRPFVNSIERPRKIILMIPAGEATEQCISEILPLLSANDILTDGGNSHFEDTERRVALAQKFGVSFMGMGVSGGAEGALHGPSLMLGGNHNAYTAIENDLQKVAAKNQKGAPCVGWLGEGGAGHFVKMVHNGIEYAEMQLLSELVELAYSDNEEIRNNLIQELEKWQEKEHKNYLLGITIAILKYRDGNRPWFEKILDVASNKGTGAWATATASLMGIPNTTMAAALHARFISAQKKQREHYGKQFPKVAPENTIPLSALENTYALCRLLNHHQGFEMIREAEEKWGWVAPQSLVSTLWSEGCIIKSTLLENLAADAHSSVLDSELFQIAYKKGGADWEKVLSEAITLHIPIPCIAAAWQYFVGIKQEESFAHLIQAQRDYFGSHGLRLKENPNQSGLHGPWFKEG